MEPAAPAQGSPILFTLPQARVYVAERLAERLDMVQQWADEGKISEAEYLKLANDTLLINETLVKVIYETQLTPEQYCARRTGN